MRIKIFCEYLENPIGIDLERPRFSWQGIGALEGVKQLSYRLIVSKHKDPFEDSSMAIWDSGTVLSDLSTNITYGGEALETAERYYYQVKIIDNQMNEYLSDVGLFITGIMEKKSWKAMWMGSSQMNQNTLWFRSKLFLNKKKIKDAFAYIISPNYYVMTVNGRAVTDTVLNNAWTDYSKTILYSTYEVTNLLDQDENVIGVELGNGWNALEMGFYGDGLGEHQFSLQLLIRYEDESQGWIYSKPEEWKYTVDGPMIQNSIYQGETYDARREMDGWDTPGYDIEASGLTWMDALEFEPLLGTIKAQILEPIRVVETRKPNKIHHLADGSYTFDMGQNFAGWVKIAVKEKEGTEISISYAELEKADHSLNRVSLRGVRATDIYICKGSGTEVYEPKFTYHGFRYVQVSGLTQEPDEETIIGCVVRSSVEHIGNFECTDELINQLQSNISWTEASNLHGLPTDCPQRDERLGWLNDMTVRNECAIYNYRLPQLYTKWLQDIRDAQGTVTGAITDTAPFRRFGSRPADPVSSSFLLIPWNIYCHYRDRRIIEENYLAMKRWIAYLLRNSEHYIVKYSQMGDWASPISGTDHCSIGGGSVSTITPTRLMATGYLYYDCILMTKMAKVLGKEDDIAYYSNEARLVSSAFQKEYYNSEMKYYAANSQASNTFPLYLGLVPKEDIKLVMKNLKEDILRNDTHITTGNLCSRYMIEVLFQNGEEDLAYQLLTQTTYPSWGFMIKKGATTVWERWEEVVDEDSFLSRMASYNHPMNGAVGVSFYKYLAGIHIDEENPSFKNIIFKPIPPKGLNAVKASIKTIRGNVSSRWEKDDDFNITLEYEVPFNSTADVYLPVKRVNSEKIAVKLDNILIYTDGNVVEQNKASFEGLHEGYLKFSIKAGRYRFSIEG